MSTFVVPDVILVLVVSLILLLWSLTWVWGRGSRFDANRHGGDIVAGVAIFLGGIGTFVAVIFLLIEGVIAVSA